MMWFSFQCCYTFSKSCLYRINKILKRFPFLDTYLGFHSFSNRLWVNISLILPPFFIKILRIRLTIYMVILRFQNILTAGVLPPHGLCLLWPKHVFHGIWCSLSWNFPHLNALISPWRQSVVRDCFFSEKKLSHCWNSLLNLY